MKPEPSTPHMQLSAIELALLRGRDAMARSLEESFLDDPALSWIWPDHYERRRALPPFFRAITGGTLRYGVGFHSIGHDAVSLWRRPGRIDPGRVELLRALPDLARAFRTGRARSQAMGSALQPHRPTGRDWWYLQFIGVRPSVQRTGLGGMAIRAGLDLARRAGQPVYVEVMNPANLGFYRHAGFETLTEFDLPDAGPHVWAMIRKP